jgi:hypothetical protein
MTTTSPTPVFDVDTLLGFIPPRVFFESSFDLHRPLTLLDVNFLSGLLLTSVTSGYLLDWNDFSLSSQKRTNEKSLSLTGFFQPFHLLQLNCKPILAYVFTSNDIPLSPEKRVVFELFLTAC